MFQVQQETVCCGWDSWLEEFNTIEEAQAEIKEHIEDCKFAMRCGFMEDSPTISEFKILNLETGEQHV